MSSILFRNFYREIGLLTVDSLSDPTPALIKKLPLASTIHYLGNEENPGLDTSDPLMKGYETKVAFFNVTQHDPNHTVGLVRVPNLQGNVAQFLKSNRGFQHLKDINYVRQITDRQLLVFDYSYLDQFYKAPPTKIGQFDELESKIWAFANQVKTVNVITPRNHFLILPVPVNLVAKSQLDTKSMSSQPQLSNTFFGVDEQILRHVWLFLNKQFSDRSAFGSLSDEDLKLTNLMFKMYDGKYTVLNLGYLKSFVKGNANLTFISKVSNKPFVDVQKYYLRSMMSLQNFDNSGASAQAMEAAQAEKEAKLKAVDQSEEEGSELDQRFHEDLEQEFSDVQAGVRPEKDSSSDWHKPGRNDKGVIPEVQSEIIEAQKEAEIDKDIQALEEVQSRQAAYKEATAKKAAAAKASIAKSVISNAKPDINAIKTDIDEVYTSEIPESIEDIEAELFTVRSPSEHLNHKLDKLATEGRISSSDLRKKKDLVRAASMIPDPYGSNKTVVEAAVVSKAELSIDRSESELNIPDAVIDRSMNQATLNVLGPKYNNSIIYKDMLACVQQTQKGGVIVKNHTVNTNNTFHGSYDVHTLEITPLNGQPSLIRFRVPKVNEDGSFIAKGNSYAMRKQRVDLPIRKIGEHRVGLTSYYGKAFVDRASKKANSYLATVINRLSKATIAPDEYLRDVSPGDVFDNYFEAPYIFSGISEHIQSFNAGNYHFDLNHNGFRATLDPKILKQIEVKGTRIIGHTTAGPKSLIIVDTENVFSLYNATGVTPIGDIFDVLKMDRSLAPVDYSEIKIFAKHVPVGVFLGKTIGFRKLVKLLKAKHRIVEGRQKKELQSHEYVVQFADLAYIFDRRDQVNSMILAGFHAFEKETKLFTAEMFDFPDVYLRLLESKGMNVAYLREMENLQDMFIDPITERILKEMGEPTNFNQLLIRSTELLQKYYYPASQDMDFQRIRGYERVAGFAYKELVNAVRAYKQKNSTGRGKVDMSPFQVWTTITRDSSVKHIEDSNPIQSIKIAQEAVTYVGEGGRGKESMNRESRAYLTSDLGMTGESSVDSSDVGINTFLSANPLFANLDGSKEKVNEISATSLLGTSALLAPFSSNDDLCIES